MQVITTTSLPMTVGLDLGDRRSRYCLRSSEKIIEQGSMTMSPGGVQRCLRSLVARGARRLVLEVGSQSAWVSRAAAEQGLEVVVANPRRVRLISHDVCKTDQRDARILAELGQLRPGLLSPVEHRGEEAQRDLIVVRTRANLVEGRTALVNEVRQRLKSQGVRIAACSSEAFPKQATPVIPEELRDTLEGTLSLIANFTAEIRRLDKKIEKLSRERHPETMLLRQVQGVGPITALTFVLTLESPKRIDKTRNVAAYLGLVPRRRQSGDSDPDLHITKAGDRALRSLLVNCAHYILGPFGQDSDLRRHGLRIAGTGARTAKKRAVVAVARKLSVLLLSLWRSGEVYEPLRHSQRLESQAV